MSTLEFGESLRPAFDFRDTPVPNHPEGIASGGSPYSDNPREAPEFSVGIALHAIKDGLLLRCPACSKGKLFRTHFKMNQHCPNCGVVLAREQGAYVGAMYVNLLVTEAVFVVAYVIFQYGFDTSALTEILILAPLNILFPIWFFPHSRGLWAAMLYLTGDLNRDEPNSQNPALK